MRFTVVTIFPELFSAFLETSLIGRARKSGLLDIRVVDLRDYAGDPHRVVDDEPYGGGGGMVMMAGPWLEAARDLADEGTWRVLLSPQGKPLCEQSVQALAEKKDILLMCTRYEGVDNRVRELVVDQEVSIGDYVVSGGEIPAMVVMEAISRQVEGVVGTTSSVENDSFRLGILDHPHYTRPRSVEGLEVPDVLVSGNHAAIDRWRAREALRNTLEKRPDLLDSAPLDRHQRKMLEEIEEKDEPRAKM